MTDKKTEALKLALEALKQIDEAMPFPVAKLAIMEAEKALAQPEHEPVANYCKECLTYNGHHEGCSHYTTPPQRTWVGLTDEERMDILLALNWDKQLTHMDTAKSIEAKLKERNT